MIEEAVANFARLQFWVGLVCSIVGGFASYFGLALLKFAHVQNLDNPLEKRKFYLLDARWWTTFCVILLGFVFELIGLATIQMSLVIPLTGFGVFASVFYTAKRNDEHITNRDKYAVLVAAIGTMVYVALSNKIDLVLGDFTIEALTDILSPKNVLPFVFIIASVSLGFLFLILNCFKRFKNSFIATAVPAIWGCIAFMLTKMTVDLVITSLIGETNEFKQWATYVIILFMIISLILQIHFVQNTFIYYEFATSVVLYYTLTCFLSVSSSQLVFQEWDTVTFSQTILLFLGLFIQFVGVFILLSSHSTIHSLYPMTDSSVGHMIRVANVDLDEEEEVPFSLDGEDESFNMETVESSDKRSPDIHV